MRDFQGRTVLITGASRGLGAALAEAFGRAGANVALCARGVTSLEDVDRRLRELGVATVAETVDVTDEEQVDSWVDRTRRTFGRIDAVINNASLLGPRQPLWECPIGEWQEVLDVNLTGTMIVTKAVLGPMRQARMGSIINVSSGAAIPPRKEWGPYGISKSAVEAFSFNLAAELEGTGIRVNVVDPGAMRTDMRARAYPEEDPARLKTPSSIAPLFLWLADPARGGVTGRRFQADEWLRDAHR
jgi:NAD(P)-dependent dehydrogenase (short-subunit alcohol dehydrogenase family)